MSRHHQKRNGQIFVRNLDKSTTDSSFESYFSKFGRVTFHKILRDKNGRSRGLGLVEYEDTTIATYILEKKYHIIDGHKVECKPSRPRRHNIADRYKDLPKNFQTIPKHLKRIYVGDLSPQVTEAQLKDYFSKYGSIEQAFVVLDKEKKSKGYGFVGFDHPEAVDKVQDKRPHTIVNEVVQTVRTYPEGVPIDDKKPTTVLYVLNYKDGMDVNDVEEYFSKFGNIVGVSSKCKRAENLKYIELEFEDYDSVDMICLTKNHSVKNSTVTVQKYLSNGRSENANPTYDVGTSKVKPKSPPRPAKSNLKPCAPPLDELRQLPYNPNFPPNQLYPSLPPNDVIYRNTTATQSNSGNPLSSTYRYYQFNGNGMNGSRKQSNNSCIIS